MKSLFKFASVGCYLLFFNLGAYAQPVIISPPVNQTVIWGGNATFTVMATGVGPLTYQWQLNGTNLPNNIITTVAGNGNVRNLGDGGIAQMAVLNSPQSVTVDADGNVYIADTGDYSIRKVATNGTINTVAGTGFNSGYASIGRATSVSLNKPTCVIVDSNGNLLIADQLNDRICKMDTNGYLSNVAGPNVINGNGNPIGSYSGDGGPATNAGLNAPFGLALDASGNLFIADSQNYRIRKIDINGIITTVAGTGIEGYNGDGGVATNAGLEYPQGVAVDSVGNLFITDYVNNRIRKVDTNGIITTVAGDDVAGYLSDGVLATNASLYQPEGVWADTAGNFFIADSSNNRVRKVDTNGIITTVVGNGSINGGAHFPTGLGMDVSGNLFIADNANNRIIELNTNGNITTIAGNGTTTYLGDGGPANNAHLNLPTSITVDEMGNLFIADKTYQRVRMANASGVISTIAGTGIAGYNGEGGPAVNEWLNNPVGVRLDAIGNLLIVDQSNQRVRSVRLNGSIFTVVGHGAATYSGDKGPATSASLNTPSGVAVDDAGNVFIADQINQRIRKVDTNGIITTVAGNGTAAYSGDGGAATNASLNNPVGVAVDAAGNLFVADKGNNRIRRLDTNGFITTVAGTNGTGGYSGDGGLAVTNRLNAPTGVAVGANGNLFIADQKNNRIRQLDTNGIITTVAGNGTGNFSGDGDFATNASLNQPVDVAVDIAGNYYIADQNNFRIRKVSFSNLPYLTVFNVNLQNAANYSVVITSAAGSVTSSVVSVNLELPPITPAVASINGGYRFTWSALPNLTYQLQYSTNLVAADWIDLGAPLTTNGTSISTTDTAGTENQRFYRVRLKL